MKLDGVKDLVKLLCVTAPDFRPRQVLQVGPSPVTADLETIFGNL